MKSQSYMDRAMKSRDPRFARILGKMGYGRRDMAVEDQKPAPPPSADDDLVALRAAYQAKVGKRPFMGWDADTLRAKMAEAE